MICVEHLEQFLAQSKYPVKKSSFYAFYLFCLIFLRLSGDETPRTDSKTELLSTNSSFYPEFFFIWNDTVLSWFFPRQPYVWQEPQGENISQMVLFMLAYYVSGTPLDERDTLPSNKDKVPVLLEFTFQW